MLAGRASRAPGAACGLTTVKDQIEWTAAGRDELARLRRGPVLLLDDLPAERLHALTARVVERFAPAWQLGLARSDGTGRAAVGFAATALVRGALPPDAAPEQAAWAMCAISPIGDMTGPLAEQIMRRGAAFAIAALVAATALRVESVSVPGAMTEDRQAISIRAIGDDERDRRMTGAHTLAAYLAQVMRGTNAARAAGLRREAAAAWATASTDTRLLFVRFTDDAPARRNSPGRCSPRRRRMTGTGSGSSRTCCTTLRWSPRCASSTACTLTCASSTTSASPRCRCTSARSGRSARTTRPRS